MGTKDYRHIIRMKTNACLNVKTIYRLASLGMLYKLCNRFSIRKLRKTLIAALILLIKLVVLITAWIKMEKTANSRWHWCFLSTLAPVYKSYKLHIFFVWIQAAKYKVQSNRYMFFQHSNYVDIHHRANYVYHQTFRPVCKFLEKHRELLGFVNMLCSRQHKKRN